MNFTLLSRLSSPLKVMYEFRQNLKMFVFVNSFFEFSKRIKKKIKK